MDSPRRGKYFSILMDLCQMRWWWAEIELRNSRENRDTDASPGEFASEISTNRCNSMSQSEWCRLCKNRTTWWKIINKRVGRSVIGSWSWRRGGRFRLGNKYLNRRLPSVNRVSIRLGKNNRTSSILIHLSSFFFTHPNPSSSVQIKQVQALQDIVCSYNLCDLFAPVTSHRGSHFHNDFARDASSH